MTRAHEQHVEELWAKLRACVENAYVYFAYPAPRKRLANDYGMSDEQEAALRAVPLRQLTTETIDPFLSHVITFNGYSHELRHFLPRALELAAFPELPEKRNDVNWFPLVFALEGNAWRDWPIHGQRVIDEFFLMHWRLMLALPIGDLDETGFSFEWPKTVDWICHISEAFDDLSPFFQAFDEETRSDTGAVRALTHVASFLIMYFSVQPHRMGSIKIDCSSGPEAGEQLLNWLASERMGDQLERAFFLADEPLVSNAISKGATVHANIRRG